MANDEDETGPIPPLAAEEYAVLRNAPDEMLAAFTSRGMSLDKLSNVEAREDIKDMVALLRSAIEGYEASHPDAPRAGAVVHLTKIMSGIEVDRILAELDQALEGTLAWDVEDGRVYHVTDFGDDAAAAREHVRQLLSGISETWSIHVRIVAPPN
jgi:phosphoribosylamine-glycine ligase